jgi:hypothetical protein
VLGSPAQHPAAPNAAPPALDLNRLGSSSPGDATTAAGNEALAWLNEPDTAESIGSGRDGWGGGGSSAERHGSGGSDSSSARLFGLQAKDRPPGAASASEQAAAAAKLQALQRRRAVSQRRAAAQRQPKAAALGVVATSVDAASVAAAVAETLPPASTVSPLGVNSKKAVPGKAAARLKKLMREVQSLRLTSRHVFMTPGLLPSQPVFLTVNPRWKTCTCRWRSSGGGGERNGCGSS